jgi:hypothetical protein
MPPEGFVPTISTGDRPQTYALDRSANVTGQGGYINAFTLLKLTIVV